MLSNSGDLELGSSGDRRDANEVGHLELVDKLSVAAGVTAKDKREKNKVNSSIHSRMSKRGQSLCIHFWAIACFGFGFL